MKKYEALFKQDSEYYKKAIAISKRVKDLSEFISDFNLDLDYKQQTQVFNNKVITYHDACHLIHAQRISSQPRKLIRSISGIDYRELPEASWCCGSAGIYNIINYDDSMKILKRKIENIRSVKPDIIVTGNPGCIIQIEHGLRKENLNIEVLHIATFLRKAYGI
jgi:glycolate oxidase iron-sulfur subunit